MATANAEGEDSWYLALEPSHKYLSKDVGYRKQVQMKLQKKPHVLDVQGIRRICHLYGSTAMFASQAKTNACHWGDFAKTHEAALDQAHEILEAEGYTNSRTRSAAKTVYVPAEELEAQGLKPEIGGPITATQALKLIQTYPQPFHAKTQPFRLDLGWDFEETLFDEDENITSDRPTPPTSRAQVLFTTPHRAEKMAPNKPKKRAADKATPPQSLHESLDNPDDVVSVHALAVFAKEACQAETEIGFLYEVHPTSGFLKTCIEAVKLLPDHAAVADQVIERYSTSSKPGGQTELTFAERVRNTLPTSPENRDCYVDETRQNPFVTTPRNRFALSLASPRASRSAYAPAPNTTTTTPNQAPSNASFYQDLAADLAKLAAPNDLARLGEAKVVGVEGKGKITLVVLVSRSDSWVIPELWAPCIEKFLDDNRVGDLATTSLNFWARVLGMQDIKTRFGLSRKEDGSFDKIVPQQTIETCGARYGALDFGKTNRKLGLSICFFRKENISQRDKLASASVQDELANISSNDLEGVLGFHPSESPFGVASVSGLTEL